MRQKFVGNEDWEKFKKLPKSEKVLYIIEHYGEIFNNERELRNNNVYYTMSTQFNLTTSELYKHFMKWGFLKMGKSKKLSSPYYQTDLSGLHYYMGDIFKALTYYYKVGGRKYCKKVWYKLKSAIEKNDEYKIREILSVILYKDKHKNLMVGTITKKIKFDKYEIMITKPDLLEGKDINEEYEKLRLSLIPEVGIVYLFSEKDIKNIDSALEKDKRIDYVGIKCIPHKFISKEKLYLKGDINV